MDGELPAEAEQLGLWPNTPVRSCASRPDMGRWPRSRTVVAVRSRPRLRGHRTSTPTRCSSVSPSSSRLSSSSPSSVIWSGTRSSSSRSSTGHASAAPRRAMAAWVRARSPKPCPRSESSPVHSSAASHRCSGFCSSWTCRTRRTAPASSSSSSASTRSEIRTSWGQVARQAPDSPCLPPARGSAAEPRLQPTPRSRPGRAPTCLAVRRARGTESATASRTARTTSSAASASSPS